MLNPILLVCVFTACIHFFESAALSLRLAGARTGQIATALAFVNSSFLVARLSNMFQAPLLGSMVDHAVHAGNIDALLVDFKWIVFFAFLGNALAVLFFPFLVRMSVILILEFEKKGSLPKAVLSLFRVSNLKKVFRKISFPDLNIKNFSLKGIPRGMLVLNACMVAIYAVGVLSSLLAGAALPEFRATAIQLSGIVNGMATMMLALFVDPGSAYITDQAVRGKRSLEDVRVLTFYLLLGRLVGTLILAQILLYPASVYIQSVTVWVTRHFH